MPTRPEIPSLWSNWLLAACAGVVLFGLLLVVAPGWSRHGFSWLVYASPARLDALGAEVVRYVSLVHAVIGGVMIGWGVALLFLARAVRARRSQRAWTAIAVSLVAWFVPDTAYSLLAGYWQNALLNTAFAALFSVPLLGIRRHLDRGA